LLLLSAAMLLPGRLLSETMSLRLSTAVWLLRRLLREEVSVRVHPADVRPLRRLLPEAVSPDMLAVRVASLLQVSTQAAAV
jgi:hypothetical protein